jgi:hypothetical protein
MKDEIVEEVRAAREKIFAEHDCDLKKLCEWLMGLQGQPGLPRDELSKRDASAAEQPQR